MHSVSTYPCPPEKLNLNNIPFMRKNINAKLDTAGMNQVSSFIFAASLGATSIERHITLDRTMYGSDQAASLEESGLKILVDTIRLLQMTLGRKGKIFIQKKFQLQIN